MRISLAGWPSWEGMDWMVGHPLMPFKRKKWMAASREALMVSSSSRVI